MKERIKWLKNTITKYAIYNILNNKFQSLGFLASPNDRVIKKKKIS